MKPLLYPLIILFLLSSCSSSKNYLSRIDEDKTLFDAVKVLSKHPTDSDAVNALPVLYSHAQERHLKKIQIYQASADLNRWEKILNEYSILQKMFDIIRQTDAADRLVSVTNYQSTINDLKQSAADAYYQQAIISLAKDERAEAKLAYNYFKRADKLVPGFKDAKAKMNEAYQAAIVNVLINPVIDNSFFFNTSWGNYGYNYSNEYFQQTLVRELGGQNSSRYPARFYTEWEARRDNVKPDIVVNLSLRNMDIPRPATQYYTRNISKQVFIGRDTSGNAIYKTIYAQLNITKQSLTANIEMEVDITDVIKRRKISNTTFRENYSWQEERGSYSGSAEALSDNDWALINNSRLIEPTKEEALNELYRRIYPQVKNRISNAVDW